MRGSYKLAKVECGIAHYADIEIELVESHDTVETDTSRVKPTGAFWIPDAQRGVADAIASTGMEQFKLRSICRLEGTWVDTSPHGVWLAALLATMDALRMKEHIRSFSFKKSHWEVELDNGSRMSS